MENWQLALIILVAVFVGACIPALVQLLLTLRTANSLMRDGERAVRETGRNFQQAMREVTLLAHNVNRASSTVELGAEQVKSLFEAVGSLTEWVLTLRKVLSVFSAVGATLAPAVGEAIRAAHENSEAEVEADAFPPPPPPRADGVPGPMMRNDGYKEELRS